MERLLLFIGFFGDLDGISSLLQKANLHNLSRGSKNLSVDAFVERFEELRQRTIDKLTVIADTLIPDFGDSSFFRFQISIICTMISLICTEFSEICAESWQNVKDENSENLVDKLWYAVVVSTLSIVYQYLLADVFKRGTRTYSSSSLDFRDIFVSVLLFQGSYVWIKFRDIASNSRAYRRSRTDAAGNVTYYGKYEPRFKPPREKQSTGTSLKLDRLPLGGYYSKRDAEIVYQIAAYYYDKDEARITLGNGSYFIIPPMPEQEQSLSGLDKVQWVAARAKEVFKDLQQMNDATILPSGVHGSSLAVTCEEFSFDALWEEVDAHPVDGEFVNSLCAVGEGLEGFTTSLSGGELPGCLDNDAEVMTKQESSTQQLNKNLEAELGFDDQWKDVDAHPVDPEFVNTFAVGEGLEGLTTSPSVAELPQSLDNDAEVMTTQPRSTQQPKEHLEAECQQHEQHLQRVNQLEEHISQLRQDYEQLCQDYEQLHQDYEQLKTRLQ